jgi:hypothetical protein
MGDATIDEALEVAHEYCISNRYGATELPRGAA